MNAFQKTAITTVIATLLLISVGGLVRVSGAGLGCPDWPMCWGCWLPPSSVDEIDMAYIEAKGFDIREFNPTKMWIEYINRMVGVLIGILIFITFLRSIRYRTVQPVIFRCALLSFLLVGFQGWLGGQVVRSGLIPGIITLHMMLAIILVSLLIYATFQAMKTKIHAHIPAEIRNRFWQMALLLFILTGLQVLLGTQVREAIDPFIKDSGGVPRDQWLLEAGWVDHIHRASSWLVLIASGMMYWWIRKHQIQGILHTLGLLLLGGVFMQMALGVILAYASLPPAAQVLHLTIATLLICLEYYVILIVRHSSAEYQTAEP